MKSPHDKAGWTAVDDYFAGLLLPPDDTLAAAQAASTAAGLPAISVAANQGKMLELLARLRGARRILEVGTLGGYSTIWLARALPADGQLVTLEFSPAHAAVARANLDRAGFADRVEIHVGPALETLARLTGAFDLIFIDADKENYAAYFDWAVRLARPGTLIIADNVVRGGGVVDPSHEDPRVQGIRRFVERLAADSRVSATAVQTVGSKGYDGFILALVV